MKRTNDCTVDYVLAAIERNKGRYRIYTYAVANGNCFSCIVCESETSNKSYVIHQTIINGKSGNQRGKIYTGYCSQQLWHKLLDIAVHIHGTRDNLILNIEDC